MTVPMVGTGSWEDPKRPAFVRETGVPFRFQLSDDGTMAIVEATPRDLGELNRLDALVRREPRARMFRPERDRLAAVVAALRVLKKDFDPETFGRSGPPLPPEGAR